MTKPEIINCRIINQQIAETKFKKAEEIVSWMGAIQAQDFAMAKWAIGLRLPGLNDAGIEKSFNNGTILRTHVLRPTWHFVSPADIRWMLELTAPRVIAASAFMYRKLELNDKIFRRSNSLLIKALTGKNYLTRAILKSILERAKIIADGIKLACIIMRSELDGIICSGPRIGGQFTYALLDERAPVVKPFNRDEALAELTLRYFTSRGPATLHDFVWWSGLTVRDAREGISMLNSKFIREVINGKEYLFVRCSHSNKKIQKTFLLPAYDEYAISYKDRSAIFNLENIKSEMGNSNLLFNPMVIINGMIAGTWKRGSKNKSVEANFFSELNNSKQHDIKKAVKRYREFTGRNR